MNENRNEITLGRFIQRELTVDQARRILHAICEAGVTEQQLGKVFCNALQTHPGDEIDHATCAHERGECHWQSDNLSGF